MSFSYGKKFGGNYGIFFGVEDQFGLSARYASTKSIYRWGVKMLLAAIVQTMFWIIGVIAHSQNYQRAFQANTVRDKKVFSYFYLGN